jgi:hypothetical protein
MHWALVYHRISIPTLVFQLCHVRALPNSYNTFFIIYYLLSCTGPQFIVSSQYLHWCFSCVMVERCPIVTFFLLIIYYHALYLHWFFSCVMTGHCPTVTTHTGPQFIISIPIHALDLSLSSDLTNYHALGLGLSSHLNTYTVVSVVSWQSVAL